MYLRTDYNKFWQDQEIRPIDDFKAQLEVTGSRSGV